MQTGQPNEEQLTQLFSSAKQGDRRALARILSVVEAGQQDAVFLDRMALSVGDAGLVVGITGAPGAGKSSLLDLLVGQARKQGKRVAVVAVDPSSPFTQGAILGDRVRMQSVNDDEGVFVRSLASRGLSGGLSLAARRCVRTFLACGYDVVFVETVGVGQIELDVASATDVVVVVLTPNAGDEVQAAKAGILEIGDVFAINKADLPGADMVARDLSYELSLSSSQKTPKIIQTSTINGRGLEDLWNAIDEFYESGSEEKIHGRGHQRAKEALQIAGDVMHQHLSDAFSKDLLEQLSNAEVDPVTAARQIVDHVIGESK